MTQALEKAIQICGGQAALARQLGVRQQNVWSWLHRTKRVKPEYVLGIEEATGGEVTRHELRPDIYPPPEVVA